MPQAALVAISAIVVASKVALIVKVIASVFLYAASYALQRRAERSKERKARQLAGLGPGLETNYFDTSAYIRIVYGTMRIGGMETIPPLLGGDNGQFLEKVLTWSGVAVDTYTHVHFDADTVATTDIYTHYTPFDISSAGLVTGGKYAGKARVRNYTGVETFSDVWLAAAFSGSWANAKAVGIAKTALTFVFDRVLYQQVPSVTVTVRGARVYDPRLDSSPGAAPANASFIAYSTNPALVLADYLLKPFGGDYEAADIDWDTIVVAANYCDVLVNIPGGGTRKRYELNGVIYASEDFIENVKLIVNTMLGRIVYRDAKWRVYAGSWKTPSFTIQKKDWISGLSIRFEQGARRRFSTSRCWYIDRDREFQRVQCTPRVSSTYRTADSGVELEGTVDQVLCTDEFQAQSVAEFILRGSRNQIIVSGKLGPKMMDIATWDTGTIVFDHLGWSSKTFRCIAMDLNADGSSDCVFLEEQSSDWNDMLAADYNAESTHPIPVINETIPSAPTSLSVTESISGTLLFNIGTPLIAPFDTRYQLIRSTNSANANVGTVVYEGNIQRFDLISPASNHWYYARAVNDYGFSAFTPNTFGVLGLPAGWTTRQIGIDQITEIIFVEVSSASISDSISYEVATHINTWVGQATYAVGANTVSAILVVQGSFRPGLSDAMDIFARAEATSAAPPVFNQPQQSKITIEQDTGATVLQAAMVSTNLNLIPNVTYRVGLFTRFFGLDPGATNYEFRNVRSRMGLWKR